MNPRSLFVTVAALLAALLAYWAFAERAPVPPQTVIATPAVDPAVATEAAASPVEESERATVAAPELPTEPPPERVAPWIAKFLVVDDEEQPVADATVTIWAMWSSGGLANQPFGDGARWGRVEPPLFELRTDGRGRTQTVVTVQAYLAEARKDGFRTGQCSGGTHAAGADTILVLGASRPVRGIVLDVDDRPVAGARVVAADPHPGNSASTIAATTGADGRFSLLAHRGALYDLEGELEERRTFRERVRVVPALPEVTLRFPGGITIRGSVVDAKGRPASMARVLTSRERGLPAPGLVGEEHEHCQTTKDGGFSIAVQTYGRYQLIVSKPGHASSKPVWVETTAERPHPDVRLELQALATIRGRVVQADGSPCARMLVGAQPESAQSLASIQSGLPDPFPRADDLTADDGTFELLVHPDTTWTLLARNAEDLLPQVREPRVSPGRADVVLRVTAADIAGCVVRGTVVRSDGKPAVGYKVFVVEYGHENEVTRNTVVHPKIEGSTFTLAPLPLGRRYAVRVVMDRTSPVASTHAGPFTTDRADVRLEFRLPPWAALPVRLLDAEGAPVRGAIVAVDSLVGFEACVQGRAGPDGCTTLHHLCPGDTTLRVYDDSGELCKQQVVVAPGQNPELVVRLPARK